MFLWQQTMLRFVLLAGLSGLGLLVQAQNTLQQVRERGELRCGINGLDPGDSIRLNDGGILGFHASFCQAIAAGLLGSSERVLYVPLYAANAFAELIEGQVDMLVGNTPFIASYSLNQDIRFGPIIFHHDNVPYAVVVQKADEAWLDTITWLSYALIQAEEWGIRSDNVTDFQDSPSSQIQQFLGYKGSPLARLGLPAEVLRTMIAEVGNYAELYDRHLGEASSLNLARGLNKLYTDGGLLYSPPFLSR